MASEEFTDCMITTAVENGGMGWFYVRAYRWQNLAPGEVYADVVDREEWDESEEAAPVHRINRSVILSGLRVMDTHVLQDVPYDGMVPHNTATGERLYLSAESCRRIVAASQDPDGDGAGDIDAVDALAIVECGLFGKVVYG